jgi:hypothetical protein
MLYEPTLVYPQTFYTDLRSLFCEALDETRVQSRQEWEQVHPLGSATDKRAKIILG